MMQLNHKWKGNSIPINILSWVIVIFSLLILLLTASVAEAEVVEFPDPNLEAAIRSAIDKPTGKINESDLVGLTALDAENRGIFELSGLEYCTNLTWLNLNDNNVSNLSPISNLPNLQHLYLNDNAVNGLFLLSSFNNLQELHLENNDMSYIFLLSSLKNLQKLHLDNNNINYPFFLSSLSNLQELHLNNNDMSNLSPLSGLNNLRELYLNYNNISDINPLSSLPNLTLLCLLQNNISDIEPLVNNAGISGGDIIDLRENPLNARSLDDYVPQLKERGTEVLYTAPPPIAGFWATPLSGDEPLTVSFTDISSSYEDIVSWLWNFGDGQTSTDQNPSHEYAHDGDYTVSLTVTEADDDFDVEIKVDYISVNEVNTAPVLAGIGNKSVNEGTKITFTATATDTDIPANVLAYSLVGAVPEGASINSTTGVFSWTPAEGQNGTHTFTVKVVDNGSPVLSDEEEIKITVNEVNTAPVLAGIGNRSVNEGTKITFTATATDTDIPANVLTYSLVGVVPEGASINSTTGVFSWTPSGSQNGIYNITVRVRDNGTPIMYDEETLSITVNDSGPKADFSAASLSGDEPLTVHFIDYSISYDGIVSWFWSFGDGQTSTQQNPTHVFTQNGHYTVSLTIAESDDDSDIETKTGLITVFNAGPEADFSATSLSGAEPRTVSFTDTSTSYDGINSWFWDFGDGQTSTQKNPTHVYPQNGLYTISLTVAETDADSDVEIKTDFIIVYDTAPAASFSANILSGNEPLVVYFTDTSISYEDIVRWLWNFGDGQTSTQQNPNHVYTQDGSYTVSLTVTDSDGSSDTETKADYVIISDTGLAASFSATPISGSEPLTVSFTDTSTSYDGSTSWLWDFGDGQTSTQKNPNHVYTHDGNYTVSLTVTDSDGSSNTETKTDYITVLDTGPKADFSAKTLSGSLPLTVSFINSSTSNDGIILWHWEFGDGQTSSEQNPTHEYVQYGNYTVLLTVTDSDGRSDTETKTDYITVSNTVPKADFSASSLSGDEPLTVYFMDYSISYDGVVSWSWDFGDGQTSGEQNPTHEYAQDGKYTVSLTVTDNDGRRDTETKTDYITVSDTGPTADFSATTLSGSKPLTVSFTNSSTSNDDNVSWFWEFGDGQTSSEQNPTHEYAENGDYTVSLTITDSDSRSDTETKTDYIAVNGTSSWMGLTALAGLAVVGLMSGITIIRRLGLKNGKKR